VQLALAIVVNDEWSRWEGSQNIARQGSEAIDFE